jgi:hypothetical protein
MISFFPSLTVNKEKIIYSPSLALLRTRTLHPWFSPEQREDGDYIHCILLVLVSSPRDSASSTSPSLTAQQGRLIFLPRELTRR